MPLKEENLHIKGLGHSHVDSENLLMKSFNRKFHAFYEILGKKITN